MNSITKTAKDFVKREQNVIDSFCEYVIKTIGCNKKQAWRIYDYFIQHHLMTISVVNGTFKVKHGGLLDNKPLKRCLELTTIN